MGSSINHTVALNLKNNSGIAVSRGDIVIIDKNLADAFTVTGSQALSNSMIGVVLDQVGISSGNSGMIVISGYAPQVNLLTGSNLGDKIYLSSVSGKGMPHSNPLAGDFGQVLSSGLTPDAVLWGNSINQFPDLTDSGGDIFTAGWTDYSSISVVTGWSSFVRKNLRYKTIGKLVFVAVDIYGTSNSGSTSVTLPYTASNTLVVWDSFIRATDNGVSAVSPGLMEISGGTATAGFYKDNTGAGWTASGNKAVAGIFWYQAA